MRRAASATHPGWFEYWFDIAAYILLPDMALEYEDAGFGPAEVGDIIPGGHDFVVEIIEAPTGKLGSMWVNAYFLDGFNYKGPAVVKYTNVQHRWRKPSVAGRVAGTDDGFNGNCSNCGRRTYIGATPAGFEHQGGPCL